MPNIPLSERQKRIVRAFSNGLRDRPEKTKWSFNTQQSDDNGFELAVDINSGIPTVDKIQDILMSDLKLFKQIGLITPVGREAFRVNASKIHRLARK